MFGRRSALAVARNTVPSYREAIMVRSTFSSIGIALTLIGCGASRAPVPVVGTSSDVSALAGDWVGEYSSSESGRSGSISFSLQSATDSAVGDVVMIPTGLGSPLSPWQPDNTVNTNPGTQAAPSKVLTIRFVRVTGGQVSGTLEPYADPQTGARLITTFTGELKGNAITGTYTTQLAAGGTQTGRWTVERKQ
jgi:hypothetical protein